LTVNRFARFAFSTGCAAAAVVAAPAAAAEDQDPPRLAAVTLEKACLVSEPTAGDADAVSVESVGGALGTLAAGFVGDVVKEAGNALGAALEEAARKRSFSASGTASFNAYKVMPAVTTEHRDARLESVLAEEKSSCLILSYPGSDGGGADIALAQLKPLSGAGDDERKWLGWVKNTTSEWTKRGLPATPALYVEAELQKRRDGFIVRPVMIWYRERLPGAPGRKALPSELHAIFATPDNSDKSELGTVFALARTKLPPLAPGTLMQAAALKPYASPVVPNRPTAGSPDTTLAAYKAAYAARDANAAEVKRLEVAVQRASAKARARGAKQEAKDLHQTLADQLAAEKAKTGKLAAAVKRVEDATSSGGYPVGSTNASLRLALLRGEDAFGMAIARALKTRSAELGTAVTAELKPEPRTAAWNDKDTAYVTAMATVDTDQRALRKAEASGDEDEYFKAQIKLRTSKATANAAAAAAERELPFPYID
jgi:hypothetical protein